MKSKRKMGNQVKEFVLGLGVDDVGFLAGKDYRSEASPIRN